MINITKPYLPDRKKLNEYIDKIYDTAWLTNNGPLVQELTKRLEEYLGVENLLLVCNGTLALQVAYKVLGIKGNTITTPFSFVATTSSLVWEGIEPIFVDIDPDTFCIDPFKVEDAITVKTTAIVPVHVFGNACEVEEIESIAKKHNLKTIYDGAHAFGVKYKGESLLSCGDATTLSFHATKLFHTIEGGAIIFKNREDYERAKLMINFGINDSNLIAELGINAKMNEFQAAMGLCVLDEMDIILEQRSEIWDYYENALKDHVQLQKRHLQCTNNYSYFPVLFESKERLMKVKAAMNTNGINPRRYFSPSLDNLGYLKPKELQTVSGDIANRVLCLPLYPSLPIDKMKEIIDISKL
ncbi:DegT/DnrJ/EryC1/StrS family aminotransferase [Methanococcoides alaskense]|uniref:dTDP-4-amino-4,6-dideoxygalactose transaminase n=1 Tax=Methanococcoides alaskense TaxID=325778 RepID=A0AA90Z8L7_9EURY|nr:DegT/DnrJ/EryC1/StrS family aminotransferase [Methanococcoides alaskense]MDA0524837.1 DegT/DnrJ/EryC1/StrS family aminotransferase [Methanococcoides alaskense]MDR6223039.1 dTDP-4-amino-4,6-dideoxygalactose transaminase [Methanococcoides alaskense]